MGRDNEHGGRDRVDGTGRGRRGDRKEGGGRGNWGNAKGEEGEAVEGESPAVVEGEEPVEEAKVEAVVEPEEESEEEGLTYDEYLKTKQAASVKLAGKKTVQVASEACTASEKTQIKQIDAKVTKNDSHAASKAVGSEFMGFSVGNDNDDFDFEADSRRGGRGGARDAAPRATRGAAKNAKLNVANEEDFPSL